eukprot:COSAG02_NODE_17357_length_1010_cov_0.622393_1_plen_232_part_01
MGDISVLFVAIVRNDDPAKVIAAENYRSDVSKHNRKEIESSIRRELDKSTGAGRPTVATDPQAFLCSHELDLSTVGGRPWACVVCATETYLDGNALACAKEIAQQLEDSMDTQQELEAWARSSKGGASGGLTKKFKWLGSIREKWDKEIKTAEIQRDLALVKVYSSHSVPRQSILQLFTCRVASRNYSRPRHVGRAQGLVNENIEVQLGNIESADELRGQANQLQAAGNQFK